mmetsp:Transcript_3179/g.7189  ORF Transcript_3179/g.7189 Transcript_3179/m.7189 type:complete len:439 (-) Transcript_3179:161-1477(-)
MTVPNNLVRTLRFLLVLPDRLANSDLLVAENVSSASRKRLEVAIDVVATRDVRVLAALFLQLLLLLPLGVEQGDAHVLLHLVEPHLLPCHRIYREVHRRLQLRADLRCVLLADQVLRNAHRPNRLLLCLHHRWLRRFGLGRWRGGLLHHGGRHGRRRRIRRLLWRRILRGGLLLWRCTRREVLRRRERILVVIEPDRLNDDEIVPVDEQVGAPLGLIHGILVRLFALLLVVEGSVLLYAGEHAHRVLRVLGDALLELLRRRETLGVRVHERSEVGEHVMRWLQEVEKRILRLAVRDAREKRAPIACDKLCRELDHVDIKRMRADWPRHRVSWFGRLERHDRRRLLYTRLLRYLNGRACGRRGRGLTGCRLAAEFRHPRCVVGVERISGQQERELSVVRLVLQDARLKFRAVTCHKLSCLINDALQVCWRRKRHAGRSA